MTFIKACPAQAQAVCDLVNRTIRTIYPKYYPTEVVRFFLNLHTKASIFNDIHQENVYLLFRNNNLVGTGSFSSNHITRVYVDPTHQRQGYGRTIIQYLEDAIFKQHNAIILDASLPAVSLYEKLGYHTVRHEKIFLENDRVLVYDIMQKIKIENHR